MTTYAFDSTGLLPANRIPNELVDVTISNGINAYLIIPDSAPFYGDSTFSIVNASGISLQPGIDFYFCLPWGPGTTFTGKSIFGGITLLSGYAVGVYRLNYQTVGGEYVTSELNTIQSGIIASNSSYVNVDWSTAPTAFPPIPESQILTGLTGMTQVFQGLERIATALETSSTGISVNDITDLNVNYIQTVITPFIELINTIVINNNAFSELFTVILNSIMPFLTISTLPSNAQYYSIPFFNLTIKIDIQTFTLTTAPTAIVFNGGGFNTNCLFAIATTSFQNITLPPSGDTVQLGAPNKSGVNCQINFSSSTPGTRIVTCFSIGI